jgi:hypothetical protein
VVFPGSFVEFVNCQEDCFVPRFIGFVRAGFALRNYQVEKFTEQKIVSCAWMGLLSDLYVSAVIF